ncbi:hypothetical protein T492DRAFT_599301 [Pavlovales sp. CCMP2436]|nr:hypothetical protein T492DRAFT_599301 [Pavlovales sp. CCMP2436]
MRTVSCREPARGTPADPPQASRGTDGGGKDGALDPFAERLASVITSAMMRLGSAGFLGFCAGIVLKRATTEAAYTVGVAFVFLQLLAYRGYIDIQWKRLREDLLYLVDTDGDGEITRKDVLAYIRTLLSVLVYKLPSTTGFTAGLVYGWRWS